jgi:hypothetical protein
MEVVTGEIEKGFFFFARGEIGELANAIVPAKTVMPAAEDVAAAAVAAELDAVAAVDAVVEDAVAVEAGVVACARRIGSKAL